MSMAIQNMLTLADLYFTDGNGNFRFQWSNQAFVDEDLSAPSSELLEDYGEDRYWVAYGLYEYAQKHLNDGSGKAVSYRINLYDETTGTLIASQTVEGFSAEFSLGEGRYFWNVEALNAAGQVITASEKAYFCNPDFENYDDIDAKICYDGGSKGNHQIAYVEGSDGAVCGRIISGDNEAYLQVCGFGLHPDSAWDYAKKNGYIFTLGELDCFVSDNCLVSNGCLYVYEEGQWNYKLFNSPGLDIWGNDYAAEEDGRTVYQYDARNNTMQVILSSAKDIYGASNFYYMTADGIFSIKDQRQVLEYDVKYGEHLLYDDLFFNIYAKDSSGKSMDLLAKGKRGSVVVKYFFLDQKTGEIQEKEVTIFSGTAKEDFDTEEIFSARIGNCICFSVENVAYIHEIQEDGSIKMHEKELDDCGDEFTVNSEGKLILWFGDLEQDPHTFDDIDVIWNTYTPEPDGVEVFIGDKNGLSFEIKGENFIIDYSPDNFASTLRAATEGSAVDTYGLPAGKYDVRISADGAQSWKPSISVTSDNDTLPKKYISDADGNLDVFFANTKEKWGAGYSAQHDGFLNGWNGTQEQISLNGKNKISSVFVGSEDANILILSDDANGDALFVDDIYTAFGQSSSRMVEIKEIRAGAGDDVIDMTSQRYAYAGEEMTIRGGSGNDVIWGAGADNDIFGDEGNDRIIGSAGFDAIAGGAGDDRMHSGGGNDIFTFCENWGNDTVEITSDSTITLWFLTGDIANWDAENRIYRDGSHSVKVIDGNDSKIILQFGDQGGQYDDLLAIGAFAASTGSRIFESGSDDDGGSGELILSSASDEFIEKMESAGITVTLG